MTTSTFSSLAMSPPLFGRDMRHVGDAEGLVPFHGPVHHIDRVAARDQIDERPGGALPPVELVTRSDAVDVVRSEEHTSELQSRSDLVCRLLLEKKKQRTTNDI